MTNLALFLNIFAFFFAVYLVVAGAAYAATWWLGRERYLHRRIQQNPRPAQVGREIFWSAISIMIISALLTVTWYAAGQGWIKSYLDINQYSLWWLAISVLVMALVHDSYYYWAHRGMHHPSVFRYVHKLHHGFTNPTPFASYAFHPLEAVVEVAWFLPLAAVVPLHPLAVGIYIFVLTVLNVISHLGYEFYRPGVGQWFITSTHHNMHHSRAKGHFMLYFNFWDKWMGTNATDYTSQLQRVAEARRAAKEQSPA